MSMGTMKINDGGLERHVKSVLADPNKSIARKRLMDIFNGLPADLADSMLYEETLWYIEDGVLQFAEVIPDVN